MDQATRDRLVACTPTVKSSIVILEGVPDKDTGEDLMLTVVPSTVLGMLNLFPRFPLLKDALFGGSKTGVTPLDALAMSGERAICAIIAQNQGVKSNDSKFEDWVASWPEAARIDYLLEWVPLTMPRGLPDFIGRLAKLARVLGTTAQGAQPLKSSTSESRTAGTQADSSTQSSPITPTADDTQTTSKSTSTNAAPNSDSPATGETLTS